MDAGWPGSVFNESRKVITNMTRKNEKGKEARVEEDDEKKEE